MYFKFKRKQPTCLVCFEEMTNTFFIEGFVYQTGICQGCQLKMNPKWRVIRRMGLKIHTLYDYSGFTKDLYLRYKESGDRWLAPVFLRSVWIRFLGFCVGQELVVAPSSSEREFNPNLLMIEKVGLKGHDDIFVKKAGYRQMGRSKIERSEVVDAIELINMESIHNKSVVLFDDVCTTGYTLKVCRDLIFEDVASLKVFSLFCNDI